MLLHTLAMCGRLAASIGISSLLFLVTMLIPIGVIRLIWLLPGKVVALMFAAVLPQAWVTGDPTSESHWHVVSGGGFVFLGGILFWATVVYGVLHWRSVRRAPVAPFHG